MVWFFLAKQSVAQGGMGCSIQPLVDLMSWTFLVRHTSDRLSRKVFLIKRHMTSIYAAVFFDEGGYGARQRRKSEERAV